MDTDAASAGTLPVAAVVVDSGLPHLDRVFEYAVPVELVETAVPGVRVRVRFAGRDLDGFVVARRAAAEHVGRLTPIRRVVSPEPVLTTEVLASARAVATRYGGVLGDVLRLAVPKRHAAAERALPHDPPTQPLVPAPEPGPWAAYPAGASMLRRLGAGQAPAASWLALPGQPSRLDWPRALAVAVAATLAGGRGALVVVPDHRDVERVDEALGAVLGPGQHVRLTADQGPQARYTAWLKVRRGHVRVVVGTRAAVFAPVADLGLVAWWDDGDDLHAEPRAPYPHVREVLRERARRTGAAILSAGFTRSVEVAAWVSAGELVDLRASATTVRAAAPRVVVAGEGTDVGRDGPAARGHLPSAAWRTAKAALADGPVLVQVPRRGYVPSLTCQVCRAPARCRLCHGPLGFVGHGSAAACLWCAVGCGPEGFVCPHCEGRLLRSGVVGARRTAEEIGRAFPGVPVMSSGAGEVLARVGPGSALVIATPGAEPVAEDGYAACLLLDAWAFLDRPQLDAPLEALRRWAGAAALTRPGDRSGVVVLAGVPDGVTLPAVEGLVRWDPGWLAERELAERVTLRLPPAVVIARLVGSRPAVRRALAELDPNLGVERLGPLPLPTPPTQTQTETETLTPHEGTQVQVLLRVPIAQGRALAAGLAALRATQSARKEPDPVAVRLDVSGSLL
jgi:primosomal protein N' (replication factor Y)